MLTYSRMDTETNIMQKQPRVVSPWVVWTLGIIILGMVCIFTYSWYQDWSYDRAGNQCSAQLEHMAKFPENLPPGACSELKTDDYNIIRIGISVDEALNELGKD